ncbi:MAG: hypothetical protein N4J56_001984 [Chroococcidiopsis sp. SAG 2025]|uniref:hypothetical protein n=1 Tax=Chroococcidiopsis sp. SAG 2025 TaxID=171389 RepID=UPI002936D875|nr:hypothetical protein [Chroococcidiopsis sp. SAG 2025]MDV2992330.1 hypothetical protein [Chroococcidiopsis sp. SAG 2025]
MATLIPNDPLGDAGTLQIGVENLLDNQYFPIVSQIQLTIQLILPLEVELLALNTRLTGKN